MTHGELSRAGIEQAADALSLAGRFWFSRRNLYYELVRRGRLPAPSAPGELGLGGLDAALDATERTAGPLARLLRPERVPRSMPVGDLPPDLFDYAVRRAVVVERLEPLLVLAQNGFHHRIEVALVTEDGFPEHVWAQLHRQLAAGVATRFYALHDCTLEGYGLAARLRRRLRAASSAKVLDIGLRVAHALDLGLPLRRGPMPSLRPAEALDAQEQRMLGEGSYVELEELPPLDAMRFVYRRIARRVADAGFG
jgi:hypothetical protein